MFIIHNIKPTAFKNDKNQQHSKAGPVHFSTAMSVIYIENQEFSFQSMPVEV